MINDILPWCKIYIATNGILLDKMNIEFFRFVNNNNVKIEITKYPMKYNLSYILKDEKIFFIEDNVKKNFFKYKININGTNDSYVHAAICERHGHCNILKDGKIYPCPIIANVEYFNSFFNTNFKVTEEDYIDIYKENRKEKYLNVYFSNSPFCKYCNGINREVVDWKISERKIEEWA